MPKPIQNASPPSSLATRSSTEEKKNNLNKVAQIAQQSLLFFITTPGRFETNEYIEVPIPDLSEKKLYLTKKNLKEIFRIANEFTLNIPYPFQKNSRLIEGLMIHRPNHNGSHSARQARYVEAMFDLIEKWGFPEAKVILASLTEEEKCNLLLGSYFLRAGRVDETSHKDPKPDDYYTRSALIYEAYAWQLGANPEIIEWIKGLIIDSCKPISYENKKNEFGYLLLTTAHELDLVRCFSQQSFENNIEGATRHLNVLLPNAKFYVHQLIDYAKKLTAATGSKRQIDDYSGDSKLFALCSTQGDTCWEIVQSVPIPDWMPIRSNL